MTEATEVKLSEKLQSILTSIETLTVLELAELVKALEVKFGVSAAAAAPIAIAAGGGAAQPLRPGAHLLAGAPDPRRPPQQDAYRTRLGLARPAPRQDA